MKRPLILLTSLILISACGIIDEGKNLYEDGKASINNIKTEAERVVDEFNEGKDKISETIDDAQNAVEKIKDAADAVSEITD